jgi:hypothetical protein
VPELPVALVAVVPLVDDDAVLERPLPADCLGEPLARVVVERASGRAVELPEDLVDAADDELPEVPPEELGGGGLSWLVVDVLVAGVRVADGASCLDVGGFVVAPLVAVPTSVADVGAPGADGFGVLGDGALVAGAGVVVEPVEAGATGASPVASPPQRVETPSAAAAAVVLAAGGSAAAGTSLHAASATPAVPRPTIAMAKAVPTKARPNARRR